MRFLKKKKKTIFFITKKKKIFFSKFIIWHIIKKYTSDEMNNL